LKVDSGQLTFDSLVPAADWIGRNVEGAIPYNLAMKNYCRGGASVPARFPPPAQTLQGTVLAVTAQASNK